MGGLGRSDIVNVDRCLICCSETKPSLEPEILNGAGVDGVDVSPTDLETVFTLLIRLTLRFCDRCKEAVTNAKSDHEEILDASSMIFKSLKKEITEVVNKYKGVMPREPGQIPERDTEELLNNATDNHEHDDRVEDKEIKKAIPENELVLTLSINSDKLLENESDTPSSQENQSNATQTQIDEADPKLIDIDSKEDKNPEKSNENSSVFEERSLLVSTKEMKSKEIKLPNSAVSAFDSPLQMESLVNTERPASLLAQEEPKGVSENGTDKKIDQDSPPGTLSAEEEQKLLTESTLNKTDNSHTQINQVVNAENVKLLPPKKEEENNFVGAKSSEDNEEKVSAANSAVRKPTNTIQLNIPRFPVIKQTKKAAEEETPVIKSGEIGSFTIPKFPIISNGVKKTEKKDKGVCSNSPNKIQSNSSKDEKVVCAPSPPPPDLKITNSFSLSNVPPISCAVSDERFNCSKSTTTNSRPQKTPSTPPPTVENPGSSFADLDPFLEELLNLPQTLKRKRALPQSTLNEPHGKRGKFLGENGNMHHLCLCGKSYTTNSKINQHINQMKRKESLISSPNSTNSTIQKAMNEMSCLQQLEEKEDSKKQKGPYLLKTTTVANKILQRYSPRKRTLVLQSSPPKNKYNCSNNSFFETVAANNMEKVPDSQQSASRPVLPQMAAKRPPFPGFHENKRQSSIRTPVTLHHRQPAPLPSSSYQQFAFAAKPRPTFPQRIAKQRFAFRSHPMSKPSGIRSATTHTQLPLLQSSAPSAKKWYHCGQCLNAEEGGVVKRFWSIVELTNHIHSVHGAWKCRMVNCDKRFSTHAALQNHVLKQQCNSMEAFATSKARVLTTAPISIPKINKVSKVLPLIPLPQSSKKVHKPKSKDEDIICIELDD